ncbi:MAG: amino acid ABC transporter permease [Oscillospiraceae bacterium]
MTEFFDICLLLLDGLKFTLGLFAVTIVLSLPLGLLLTFLRNGKFAPLRWLTGVYVYLMRGTPLMLQLFFFCYGLPFLPVIGKYMVMGRFTVASVAFVLNYAAYFCEIFRGGLLSIDKGQYEAAQVLGFTRVQTLLGIVLPQMLHVTLPSIANECITLLKDTALATAISITEVLFFAQKAANRLVSFLPYLAAALYYLFFNLLLTKLFDWLEKKYSY